MKIAVCSIPELTVGKVNVKDPRLDEVDKITKAKKKTYVQLEVVGEDSVLDADAILVASASSSDLILKDLEFVETRLSRAAEEADKTLLMKLKAALEKEQMLNTLGLSSEEKQALAGYGLLTIKPVIIAAPKDIENTNELYARALKEGGFLSFFTTGEKETRAWLIRKGTTAWEAAGAIHSDIQKGFIRAEIIALADFLAAGGETAAKQAGKQRLEQKEYIMQEGDITTFRFSK